MTPVLCLAHQGVSFAAAWRLMSENGGCSESTCRMAFLPGIFPVVLSGLVLWTLGEGLQFASVVAVTVSFGFGLSATIHFLNRLRLEQRPDQDPANAVERATVLDGPPLILTSWCLRAGWSSRSSPIYRRCACLAG